MRSLSSKITPAVLALCLTVGFSPVAVSHDGAHGKPLTQEKAVKRATSVIARLADADRLEESWADDATLQSAELRGTGHAKEWKLTFSNPKATQADKKTLYVFLKEDGEYVGASFTAR
jgi:hypothetical protein